MKKGTGEVAATPKGTREKFTFRFAVRQDRFVMDHIQRLGKDKLLVCCLQPTIPDQAFIVPNTIFVPEKRVCLFLDRSEFIQQGGVSVWSAIHVLRCSVSSFAMSRCCLGKTFALLQEL